MARIAGVDLPPNKRAQIGMTYIYGIGKSRATDILGKAGVDIHTKIKDLSEDDLEQDPQLCLIPRVRSRATFASASRWTSSG